MIRFSVLLAALLIVGVTLAACGPLDATATPPPTATEPAATPPLAATEPTVSPLIGNLWLLQSYGQVDAPQALPENAKVTLALTADGQASGIAACNRYSGPATIAGSTLTFGALAQTEMACAEEALMTLESAYLQALAGVDRFDLAGDQLTLHYDGGKAALVFTAAPALGLATTSWELVAIGTGEALESPVGNTGITATFTTDGSQVSGATGCNRYFGSVKLDGARITISNIGMTKMACAEEVMAQEQDFIALLERVDSFALDGNRLILYADGGNRTLSFEGGAD